MPLPFIQTLLIILSAVFSFFFSTNPLLSNFSLQLISLLTAVFLFHGFLIKKMSPDNPVLKYKNISDSIIITIITIILILNTSGINSPLFFLLDFLLFSLSLFYFPSLGFSLSLALSALFMLNSDLTNTHALTNLISLLLMAPLARFFGTQYIKLLNSKQQIKDLKHQADQLKSEVSAEETTTLLWLSLDFYNKMHQALDLVSQISSGLAFLPYHQQTKLKTLYLDLKELFKSGQELEEKIDRLTDDQN